MTDTDRVLAAFPNLIIIDDLRVQVIREAGRFTWQVSAQLPKRLNQYAEVEVMDFRRRVRAMLDAIAGEGGVVGWRLELQSIAAVKALSPAAEARLHALQALPKENRS